MKVYLDTNILLDFLDQARPSHNDVQAIVRHLIMNDIETYLSEDMLSTIYYIAKDKSKALEFFEAVLKLWKVVPFGQSLILDAISISKNGDDFEDVLQCLSAKANGCNVFITNDQKFYYCGINVMSSSEYIQSIENRREQAGRYK